MEKLFTLKNRIPEKHQRKVSYLFVGGLLFLIDYSISLFLYYVIHLPAGYASAGGFCASFIVGFTMNKKVVFTHSKTSYLTLRMQIISYLTLALINLFISAYVVNYLVNQGAKIEIVKPLLTIVIACWNYTILGMYIFGHKRQVE